MVKWNDLKLSDKWSTRNRFNYIMNYIDSTFKDNQTSNNPQTEPEPENEVETIEKGNVTVLVTNEDEEKVAGAKVTLTLNDDTYSGTTGKAGGCTIKDVPYGTYDVLTTADNYIDYTDTITVDNESVDLDITLQFE